MNVPPLVLRAKALAAGASFEGSCRDEDGQLLHVLAARRGVQRIAEIGTGCGVGAAWILSAVAPAVPFFTVEVVPEQAALVRDLFAEDPAVRVLTGDWRALLPAEAPFDLVFVHADNDESDPNAVVGLLTPGGTAVLDGFSATAPSPDHRRAAWLDHPLLAAVAVATGEHAQAIVATRTR